MSADNDQTQSSENDQSSNMNGSSAPESVESTADTPVNERELLKFSEVELSTELNRSLESMGFDTCTPIQTEAIPLILKGQDVAGLAQTGTGKTAAFVLPIMERILRSKQLSNEEASVEHSERAFKDWKARNFILILVPTRELAEQVEDNVRKFSGDSGIRSVSIYGGVSYDKQKKGLKGGVEFVVATPGRLIDLYKEHLVDLKQVRAIVFDEADRMFDMGFKDDMRFILQRVPKDRQFLLFSATLNLEVMSTAYNFGANPVEINISKDEARAENVVDEIFHVGDGDKPQHLLAILKRYKPKQAIVFSNYKMKVAQIARFLEINGIPALGISSMLSQSQRNRVISQFKQESEQNILVATDVAARGLDIQGVDLVINYELPEDAENYVHRIGRTGRAGAEGLAFSLTSERDVDSLTRIEEYLGNKVTVAWMEDEFLISDFKPMPNDRDRKRSKPGDRSGRSQQKRKQGSGQKGQQRDRKNYKGKKRKTNADGEEEQNVHRDRRSGRHKSKDQNNKKSSGKKQGKGSDNKGKPYDKKKRSNNKKKKHSNKKQMKMKSSHKDKSSLGQKVAGFFKKLFK